MLLVLFASVYVRIAIYIDSTDDKLNNKQENVKLVSTKPECTPLHVGMQTRSSQHQLKVRPTLLAHHQCFKTSLLSTGNSLEKVTEAS